VLELGTGVIGRALVRLVERMGERFFFVLRLIRVCVCVYVRDGLSGRRKGKRGVGDDDGLGDWMRGEWVVSVLALSESERGVKRCTDLDSVWTSKRELVPFRSLSICFVWKDDDEL
jgi:hypothetical protein